MSADDGRLQQVIGNLLTNAVKFSPEGRRVWLELRSDQQRVEIEVRDEGIGIERELLPKIFERFRQADTSSTRRYGGLGLGLAIVRELVELHGGEVTVDSPGRDCGATFVVALPRLHMDHTPALPRSEGAVDGAPSLVGIRVLGVDDESSAREVLAEVLHSCGATVTLASSVYDALRAIRLDTPDVIVSDIGIPELDGYSLVERVRGMSGDLSRIPLVALTAYASLQDRERALRAGFDRFLAKPLDPVRLSHLIAELVRGRLVQRSGE